MSKIKLIILAICMIYFLSPVDLIPDVIPILGYVDDAIVAFISINEVVKSIKERNE